MANQVFSAKRRQINFDFCFYDGLCATFTYMQMTQTGFDATVEFKEQNKSLSENVAFSKESLLSRIIGDDDAKAKLIEEVCTNSTISEFESALEQALANAKK